MAIAEMRISIRMREREQFLQKLELLIDFYMNNFF